MDLVAVRNYCWWEGDNERGTNKMCDALKDYINSNHGSATWQLICVRNTGQTIKGVGDGGSARSKMRFLQFLKVHIIFFLPLFTELRYFFIMKLQLEEVDRVSRKYRNHPFFQLKNW